VISNQEDLSSWLLFVAKGGKGEVTTPSKLVVAAALLPYSFEDEHIILCAK